MGTKRFYFHKFTESDFAIGLTIGLYPNLYLWLRILNVEYRIGFRIKF